jgi:hypothetical protein
MAAMPSPLGQHEPYGLQPDLVVLDTKALSIRLRS